MRRSTGADHPASRAVERQPRQAGGDGRSDPSGRTQGPSAGLTGVPDSHDLLSFETAAFRSASARLASSAALAAARSRSCARRFGHDLALRKTDGGNSSTSPRRLQQEKRRAPRERSGLPP